MLTTKNHNVIKHEMSPFSLAWLCWLFKRLISWYFICTITSNNNGCTVLVLICINWFFFQFSVFHYRGTCSHLQTPSTSTWYRRYDKINTHYERRSCFATYNPFVCRHPCEWAPVKILGPLSEVRILTWLRWLSW